LLTDKQNKMRVLLEQNPRMRREGAMLILQKENIDMLVSEQHMWLECKNNGQALACENARNT